MIFWILVVAATMSYALFQFFSAKAGGKIDGSIVPIVVNLVAIIVPLLIYYYLKNSESHSFIPNTKAGLLYASLAGVSIAGFALAFHKIFQAGGNLSYVSPLVFGGSIAISTILSAVFLKESLTLYHVAGIILVLSGISLIVVAKSQI